MKLCKLIFTSALLSLITTQTLNAQKVQNVDFGNGFRMLGQDSSYFVKVSARVQSRFDGEYQVQGVEGEPQYISEFYIKRGRLKFDGWVLSPKTKYKIEFDIVGGYVRDAWIRHNFYKNLSIQYGLGKLPGNRERVVSSQKLQFVDRSRFNDAFNIDRDNGIWLLHHFKLGESVFRETFAYTDGRGINDYTSHDGASYTGRVDFLPFGEFSSKGDFYYADFQRERTPKLMLGAVYNYNYKAIDQKGQIGPRLSDTRNLSAVFADMMLKYRGFNLSAEYAYKETTDDSPVVLRDSISGGAIESFYTGSGYVAQLAYLFKNQLEVSTRYTQINPEKVTEIPDTYEYTLGISKYIVQHNFKIQSDISYLDTDEIVDNGGEQVIVRFQIELSF